MAQKCVDHMSYDIYKHAFFFGHYRYHNHFVLRVDWIYHFYRLKKKQKTKQNYLRTFCIERLSRT